MHQKILILDFGSQYTQLIARKVRELNVYCEVHPFNESHINLSEFKGIILSGSPCSTLDGNAPQIDFEVIEHLPVLGICYGAQLMALKHGGRVEKSLIREYGRAALNIIDKNDVLFQDISNRSQVWMSHGDSIMAVGNDFVITASSENIPVAAFKSSNNKKMFGLQFHPEVYHSTEGINMLKNFVYHVCGCKGDWTPASFVLETVEDLKQKIGESKVILGLSGGVDSSVAAVLLHKAIGTKLYCVFVNNGLLRKNEYEQVLESYKGLGLNVIGVDASKRFLSELSGVSEPEQKRKIIGRVFVEVFQDEAAKIKDIAFLAQGTIYPDVIESVSVNGPSVTIKSHHNVGGLPDLLKLKLVEPLKSLFKDEVRRVGKEIDVPSEILNRHPFPGPGLAIRILGEITEDKVKMLQEADHIFINNLKSAGHYEHVWQSGAILLPVQSVGVMGDERTYEQVVALRSVQSTDGMTADFSHLPHEFLAKVSNEIINQVRGINRVVYDISSKPPATIEWE